MATHVRQSQWVRMLLVGVFALGALAACGKKEGTAQDGGTGKANAESTAMETKRSEPPRPVRTIVVGATAMGDAQFLPGEVRPRHEQRLGFRVGGKIATRKVEVGDIVKAGQVLATLDSQDVLPQIQAQAAQLASARANTKFQQSDLQRQQELRDKGFISAAAIQRQELGADTAVAQEQAAASVLANAQNALKFQTLRADRAGVVIGIDAEVGSVVSSGQSVVRIAQLGEKEVLVNVPERSVSSLRDARGIAVEIDALGAKPFAAKLRELAPTADAASRTYPARLTLNDPNDEVKLGMSANVRLDLGQAQVLVIPLTAIISRDGQARVWVVDPTTQTVRSVEITTGAMAQDGIVVSKGLAPKDIVVTAGANLLVQGQKVLMPASASTPPAVAPAAAPVAAPTETGAKK
jgi:RND family efflux transporter MFP subunit